MRPLVLLVAFLASCGGTMPRPTAPTAAAAAERWPGTTLADLERGRDLYMHRCSACHALVPPARYGEATWHEMVDEMATRASLQDPDREVILRYLVSFSKSSPSLTK